MESQINSWVFDGFSKFNFDSIDTILTGTTEVGDGYTGNIAFVTVKGVTSAKETKVFNIVLKYGKSSEKLRKQLSIDLAYHREIFVYEKIVPAFKQLENENGANIVDKILPKCFSTLIYENQEVLIFQNLKAIKYNLHDRFEPLDFNHLKLTFGNYGKWHALSLAYRDQKLEDYEMFLGNSEPVAKKLFVVLNEAFSRAETNLYSILEMENEYDLKGSLRDRFPSGFFHEIMGLLEIDEPYSVFLHGDCWNNNFMFKYSDSNNTQPQSAVFLDFQIASMASPIMDLSYHLYSTASNKELEQIKKLIDIYYASLSETLKILGSDVNILFPFDELVKQWKQYSAYGFLLAALVIPMTLSEKEDVMDLQDLLDNNKLSQKSSKHVEKKDKRVSSRLLNVTKHFVNFDSADLIK